MNKDKSGRFFKLKEDFNGFGKGEILLLGDSLTMEYFFITTEMTTGHCYSICNIPSEILEGFDEDKQRELQCLFTDFVDDNYRLNKNILKY